MSAAAANDRVEIDVARLGIFDKKERYWSTTYSRSCVTLVLQAVGVHVQLIE